MRPDQIQGNHFNPEVFPDQETLDQSDWRKGPIKTLSKPFLNLSTSSVGVNEKLHLTLRLSQQASQAQRTPPCLSNLPELKIFSFFFLFFKQCLLFLTTVWVRHFTHIDNILSFHTGSRPSKSLARYSSAHWGCVHLLPRSPRAFQLLSVGLLSFLTATTAASLLSVAGPSGPHGGTLLDYPLSKRTEEDHKTPQLLGWKPNTSWALWDSTGKPWIMASTATPSSVMPLSPLAVSLRKGSSATKVRTFQVFRWKKLNNYKEESQYMMLLLFYPDLSLWWSMFYYCLTLIVGLLFYIFSRVTLTRHSNPRLCRWFLQCIFCYLAAKAIEFHFRKFFPCCIVIEAGAQLCLKLHDRPAPVPQSVQWWVFICHSLKLMNDTLLETLGVCIIPTKKNE